MMTGRFFDLADERTGYHAIRLKIDVVSAADPADIAALAAAARRKSPWVNTFAHPNTVDVVIGGATR